MRIRINFSIPSNGLNINNQSFVNSYIHKCLGKNNNYHDAKNDYSISSIQGGKFVDDRLFFEKEPFIIVSSLNNTFIDNLVNGLYDNVKMIDDMNFLSIGFLPPAKFYDGWNHFSTLSPFLIKTNLEKNVYNFVTLDDVDFSLKVKNYLINKISKILPDENLKDFDVIIQKHKSHKIKKIMVKNVINKANQCQISINCSKTVANLLYHIGIGQSTGSGFGTVYKTENRDLYK